MVNVSPEFVDELKYILENSLHPECLDSHPWTTSPIMQEVQTDKSPGQQLILAIARLFMQMMPSTPVKHGKRLDTRWGEFGILAARYFAPIHYGTAVPASLRDTWGRIDHSILYFVYGKSPEALSEAERGAYKLVGNEPEVASISTLSDWHRKGLQRLAELIQTREKYVTNAITSVDGSSELDESKQRLQARMSNSRRVILLVLVTLFLGLLVIGGFKAYHVYELALIVRQDAKDMLSLMEQDIPRLDRIRQAGPALNTFRQDFIALKTEVEPFLWIGPWLDWVPTYGGDLVAAQDLVTMSDSLLETADISYHTFLPLLEENAHSELDLSRVTGKLLESQPQLSEAQKSLELAVAARSRIDPDRLSPKVRDLIVDDVDKVLPLLEDGLALGLELPRLLGATDEGPKTYLILVQNEDELRPTGGFITAAGTLLLQDGKISNLEFKNSGRAEDWTKPYPTAPWQLQEYMNSPVLIFRDANWFADYRRAAIYAEQLYSYKNNHSVDGVIAFDQYLIVELLNITGPIQVDGVDYPIDAGNVISYMRTAKTAPPAELYLPEWNTKDFLNKIAKALMDKIFSGDVELESLAWIFMKMLDQHHILAQLDDPVFTPLLEKYGWDGAIRPSGADFLMVLDTNVGFNKTNAVVESSLDYEIDLTKSNSLTSILLVTHTNRAVGVDSCEHWDKILIEAEEEYPIQDCYWNYLRVFTPKGAFLLDATPQSIPADWMIHKKSPPTRVDVLDEGIEGVQEFGTMQVVPASNSLTTRFQFLLPTDVLQPGPESGQWLYRLRVQKQPGTQAVPVRIRMKLPMNASVVQVPAGAVVDGNCVSLQTGLRTDLEIEVLYQTP